MNCKRVYSLSDELKDSETVKKSILFIMKNQSIIRNTIFTIFSLIFIAVLVYGDLS